MKNIEIIVSNIKERIIFLSKYRRIRDIAVKDELERWVAWMENLSYRQEMIRLGVIDPNDGSVFVYNGETDKNREMANFRAKECGGIVVPVTVHVVNNKD